jgi:hypothetical protein
MLTVAFAVMVLPALSVAVPEAVWLAPLFDSVVGPGHVSVPDSASAQLKLMVTSELFHPAAFGAGVAVGKMLGETLSRFTVAVVVAVLPAKSVAVPVIDWPAPSVNTVVGPGHPFVPDRLSVHMNETVTFELFQPLALGAGVAVATMPGADLSKFTVTVVVAVLPALSVVVPGTDWFAPSVNSVVGPGHEVVPDSASLHVKVTVTSELFHP